MQDPIVQQLIGQNPQAQAIMGSMQAHIAEHVGYAYRQKIEIALGIQLPGEEDQLPEAMEKEISRLMAEAATQVLAQSQAQVAQQQAQQNAQDPVLQIQMQDSATKAKEAEIKEKKVMSDEAAKAKEAEIKEKKVMADAAAKADEIRIKEEQIASTERIAGMNAQLKVIEDNKNRNVKQKETADKFKPTKE
jgi:uncharacterized low-complexity protein